MKIKKDRIVSTISGAANKVAFGAKKCAPELLLAGGFVFGAIGLYKACKATTKLGTVVETAKKDIQAVHEYAEKADDAEFTTTESKKHLARVYIQTGAEVTKLYAPAAIFCVMSATSILASNNIMRKRNLALASAYAVIDKSYRDYRSRVVERFGREVDHELKYNIKTEKIEETVIDEETGKEKKVKKTVPVLGSELSGFARKFDRTNPNYQKNQEYNKMFINGQLRYANDLLKMRRHLFLNEVYDMLDIPRTPAGQSVGWIYDPDNNTEHDNYIDFCAKEVFEDGEWIIILDFNVDGNIVNRFEEVV